MGKLHLLAQECEIGGDVSALKFKPKDQQVRLVFTDAPGQTMPEHQGKVFAVIGPFDDFTDKQGLMDALELVCRGWNLTES